MKMRLTSLGIFGILGVGMILGWVTRDISGTASAQGCTSENGDVNGDGGRDIGDAVAILGWLFSGGPAPEPICPAPPVVVGLPDTGQTTCYDQALAVVDCATSPDAGQDGAYDTGCSSVGRFVNNLDGTVTDLCTGLMWQQDTADTNGDGLHDYADGSDWFNALAYCENLSMAGKSDWRLPNVRELKSIVDYETSVVRIAPVFGALPYHYWSSTCWSANAQAVFTVPFDASFSGLSFGFVNFKSYPEPFLRAVRTDQ